MNIRIDINVCRVCMKSGTGVSLYKDVTFTEKFNSCTQIKASENDGLPSTICNKCVGRLKIAYDFKKQSENTDKHLRRLITQINEQFNQSINSSTQDDEEEEMQILIEAGYDPTDEVILPHNDDTVLSKIEIVEDHQIINLKSICEDGIIDTEEHTYEISEISDNKTENAFMEEHNLSHDNDDDNDNIDNDNIDNDNDEIQYTEYCVVPKTRDSEDGEEMLEMEETEELVDRKTVTLKSHICTKCNKDFSTKTNLIRHLQTHDGLKPYQCSICGARFTQNGSLKQHARIHSGERPFRCKDCGRGFTQGKSLQFHMRRHTGEKPFTCDKCGLNFRQKDGLKRHTVLKHTEVEPEGHACTICQKVLFSKYTLAMHMKKHLGEENTHKCNICDKSFSSKASLNNHNRQHTGEKPFRCDNCGKRFAQKGSLASHIKQHLEVKPFQCHICGRGFTQKHQIQAHVNMHENQPFKKFQCSKCYKSFAIKRNLVQHLRNHDRDDSSTFKCNDCDIAFNSRRGLKLHRNNQHKEFIKDLNSCEICNVPFLTVSDLNQHMISVHDNIDEKCEICGNEFISKKLFEDHMLEHELSNI